MKSKTAPQRSTPRGRMRSPAKSKTGPESTMRRASPKSKARKMISFQARHKEIHDSLDDAIKKIESGGMTVAAAKEVLEKIEIIQTLLRAAKRELEIWLKG